MRVNVRFIHQKNGHRPDRCFHVLQNISHDESARTRDIDKKKELKLRNASFNFILKSLALFFQKSRNKMKKGLLSFRNLKIYFPSKLNACGLVHFFVVISTYMTLFG